MSLLTSNHDPTREPGGITAAAASIAAAIPGVCVRSCSPLKTRTIGGCVPEPNVSWVRLLAS